MYKKKASQLDAPKNKMFNLLYFRISVIEVLTKINKPAIRKRKRSIKRLMHLQEPQEKST